MNVYARGCAFSVSVTGNPSMPVESQSQLAMLYSHRTARSASCAGTQAQVHSSARKLGTRTHPRENSTDFPEEATIHRLSCPRCLILSAQGETLGYRDTGTLKALRLVRQSKP